MNEQSQESRKKVHNFSVPVGEYLFQGEWRDTRQLRAAEALGVYVNQGYAAVSLQGEVLSSEGFSQCSGIILQNTETHATYLAHLADWSCSETQYSIMNELPDGVYTAVVVSGDLSRVTTRTLMDEEVSEFKMRFEAGGARTLIESKDLVINSGKKHWSLAYFPAEKKLKVFTRADQMVREYKLF